ncbi:MAG: PDZ domain-containing protein [Candidatus Delongbacteria bacterium]|nr:PDZ domain-containing protein [Candidatus Delongbacteria bacterium]MBN2833954.1 PDZ domain-containing protein [Candidatus Delongbacteria bacterium]
MKNKGYYRFPDIREEKIVFVSEDDLWVVSSQGGIPRRLTTNQAGVAFPKISPDGKWIIFRGAEEGHHELYQIPSEGGEVTRLTFLGTVATPIIWSDDSTAIYFSSGYKSAFDSNIFKLTLGTKDPVKVEVGQANQINFGAEKIVIGRHISDPARWKRYRGGTAGEFWVKKDQFSEFKQILKDIKTNVASPMWIDDRLYFISDHQGIGNIYSCDADGKNIERHTNSQDYYVRNASTDGVNIVYHAGADLFVLNLKTGKSTLLNIEFTSNKAQTNRKFINTSQFLQGYSLHPNGTHLSLASRGKIFTLPNWDGPVRQYGKKDGVRYRVPTWLQDEKSFIAITDELNNEDRILLVDTQTGIETIFENLEIGRVHEIYPSPKENIVILINHRNEFSLLDCNKKELTILDKSDHNRTTDGAWSPDGKWFSYAFANTPTTVILKIADVKNLKTYSITTDTIQDHSPAFSPDGKYLYFVGEREFTPVYDSIQFELSFIKSSKLYAVSLMPEYLSPFITDPKAPFEEPKDEDKTKDSKKDKDKKEIEVKIDFKNIEHRIVEFPMQAGVYFKLSAYDKKIIFMEYPRDCLKHEDNWGSSTPEADCCLKFFDLESLKIEDIVENMTDYKLSLKGGNTAIRVVNDLMVLKTGTRPEKEPKKEFSVFDGKINLNRVKVGILPLLEWKQIYREAWLLQREHFWTENMSGIDWVKVYQRYEILLDRLGSRSELSDVIWEMQGELGTSHCYEMGGDYRPAPNYTIGKLGCDFELTKNGKGYVITKILIGDPANSKEVSPLIAAGVNVGVGDIIIAIDGALVDKDISPNELLVNKSNAEVVLTILPKGKKKTKDVTVKTLASEKPILYRQWVENNRKIVHEKSNNRIGYVHVPDMGTDGFAEFHRYFLTECRFDALIVDVRYNGGGHVSQLLLEKLNRKILGYDIARWSKEPQTYPSYAINGPIVALTNEFAGSDGDIFSHSFKLMGIGKLIGKRTWGGVIGINGQYSFSDGTITTQPEYSFWFNDVEWGVENYGTDPDIEVDITPENYTKGEDPQLDKGIDLIMETLKKNPLKKPKLDKRPDLSLPKLPK